MGTGVSAEWGTLLKIDENPIGRGGQGDQCRDAGDGAPCAVPRAGAGGGWGCGGGGDGLSGDDRDDQGAGAAADLPVRSQPKTNQSCTLILDDLTDHLGGALTKTHEWLR